MKKCKKKLYIVSSLYCLLLIILKNNITPTDVVLFSKNDLSEEVFSRLSKNLKINIIFEPKNNFLKLINYIFYLKLKLRRYLIDYEIIMSCDTGLIGQFFLKNNKEYSLYEEGNTTYTNEGIKNLKLKNMLGFNKKNFGRSNLCKKMYLTGLIPIPKEIKDKSEIIDLKKLWTQKSLKEKKEILNIFNIDENVLKKLRGKKYILFTQPLSEDGFISEKEKIELYKRIIFNYSEKYLIIKEHPREKTNYLKYFPNIEILQEVFPAELLNLLEIKFEKTITIFSTAALNFSKDIKIDFYGTGIHPNLLKYCGNSEKIMKVNKFLTTK